MSSLKRIQEMLIEEFSLTADQVGPDAQLSELGIDSLAVMEFLFQLEDEFKIDIPNDHGAIQTVNDIASEIDKLLAAQQATTHA